VKIIGSVGILEKPFRSEKDTIMFRRLISVAVVLSAAIACSNSTGSSTPVTPTGPAIAMVVGASTKTTTAYSPNPLTVSKGTKVTWVNNDTVTHTTTSDTGAWNSGDVTPGGSFSVVMNSTGTLAYHCQIHPGMVATVVVQ
jgi:plastocyanin